ncbi:MAG: hypothetical protein AAF501_06495 [Pseudomonadota bacterium]
MRQCLAAIVIWLGVAAGAGADPVAVLFIGNSFTRDHDVASMVARLSEAMGGPVMRVTDGSRNGMTLDWHVREGRAVEALTSRSWDTVVLQDFSDVALVDDKRRASVAAAAILSDGAETVGTDRVFFAPWAPRRIARIDRPDAVAEIERHYRRLAERGGGAVAPVGRAWLLHRGEEDAADLRAPDDHHATLAGAYLAALTITLAVLADQSVSDVEGPGWSPDAIPDALARRLWATARAAIASAGR